MSKFVLRMLTCVILTAWPSISWGVTNAVVGACVAGTQFATIQEAVNAATQGSTVKVCPGYYPEQVTINKSLTLNGLLLGRSSVILPPVGGLAQNGVAGNGLPFSAQVLIQNATVNISNIGVDANSAGQKCLLGRWVGVAYQSAGGSLKNSSIRNGPGCADSTGILGENTTNLKITNNSIHDCAECIDLTGAVNTVISSNMIIRGAAAYWGVNLKNSPGPATISSNTIIGIETGVYVLNTPDVSVTGNTITTNPYATGIQLIGASRHAVQNNRISDALYAIAFDDTGATGTNAITHNTINDAGCGIAVGPLGGVSSETVSPNTFYVTAGWYCPYVNPN